MSTCVRIRFGVRFHYAKLLCFISVILSFLPGLAGKEDRDVKSCPSDRRKFEELQKRAQHVPEAQTILASCYDLGKNVDPSRAETIHWLSLAAEQGYAPAEYELGRIYLYGRGIPADYTLAMLWEEKAALQGEAKAQRDMAYIYERGLGVQPDPRQAAV